MARYEDDNPQNGLLGLLEEYPISFGTPWLWDQSQHQPSFRRWAEKTLLTS